MSTHRKLHARQITLLATAAIFVVLFAAASLLYSGFFSARVTVNLFSENVTLGIVAVGMTMVIIAGGIDLSVGSLIALSAVLSTLIIERTGALQKLQEVAGLDATQATELLWRTYHPYQLWYPFAAIGIASAIAIGFYASWVKKYEAADI